MVRNFGFVCLLSVMLFAGHTRAEEAKPWTDRLRLSGDFRYRHESIMEESKSDRHRHRLRARLGAKALVNDKLYVYLRLASGKGEPVSTNQDLGSADGGKQIWIDRAYLNARPTKTLSVLAGKFAVPLENAEMIWDADLNLEGVAACWSSAAKHGGPFVCGGGYWLTESATQPDQGLLAAQAGYRFNQDQRAATIAIGYADYQNLKNHAVVGGAFGNSVSVSGTGAVYLNDYNLAQLDLSGSRTWTNSTLTANVEYVVNTAASENHPARAAALAGLTFKRKLAKFDWEAAYNYRRVARDAAPGQFTDSDFIGGGTNGAGHSVSGAISPMSNTLFRVRYLSDRIDPFDNGADRSYGRLTADVEVKF
jgi:hypothetical protein